MLGVVGAETLGMLPLAPVAAARDLFRALPSVRQMDNIRPRPCCWCGWFRFLSFGGGGFTHPASWHGVQRASRCSWVSGARKPLTAYPTGAGLVVGAGGETPLLVVSGAKA